MSDKVPVTSHRCNIALVRHHSEICFSGAEENKPANTKLAKRKQLIIVHPDMWRNIDGWLMGNLIK